MSLPKSIKTAEVVDAQAEKSFIIGGHEFFVVTGSISGLRAERLLLLAPTLTVSMEFMDFHQLLTGIFQELSNITKLGDVINITNRVGNVLLETKQKTADKIVADQVDIVYKICALAIVRAGEDACIIDEAVMTQKIKIWKEHGDFLSFFLAARAISKMFRPSPQNT